MSFLSFPHILSQVEPPDSEPLFRVWLDFISSVPSNCSLLLRCLPSCFVLLQLPIFGLLSLLLFLYRPYLRGWGDCHREISRLLWLAFEIIFQPLDYNRTIEKKIPISWWNEYRRNSILYANKTDHTEERKRKPSWSLLLLSLHAGCPDVTPMVLSTFEWKLSFIKECHYFPC